VKLHLLQELLDLNLAFENVVGGLQRLEKLTLFDREDLRYTRAEIEGARADANREFFDKLGEIVEQDSTLAYKFCRRHDQRAKDPFDLYLEIKEREEIRRKKGSVSDAALTSWDGSDARRRRSSRSDIRSTAR
jgi:hypothetical protein